MNDKKNIKRQDIWFISALSAWSLLFLVIFSMSIKTGTIWPFNNFMQAGDLERATRAGNPAVFYWALTLFLILFITPWLSLFLALNKGRPRFFSKNAKISRAANGHILVSFGHIPLWAYIWLEWHLTFSQGFRRDGRRVFGLGVSIVPDFIRGNVRLHAGSDNETGTYLLSASARGDTFLLTFAEELGCIAPPDVARPAAVDSASE